MGRGRKPKPTTLKILAGAQPCRINRDEPAYSTGPVDPPAYLAGAALELWGELAPLLAASGVLTAADCQALATLCEAFRLWREQPENLKRMAEWRRLMGEFGLTPVSRSKVKAAQAAPADPLADFLKKKA